MPYPRFSPAGVVLLMLIVGRAFADTPTPPQFSTAHPLTGFGAQVQKIVASQITAGTDSTGLTVDKRSPISFTNTGSRDIVIADSEFNLLTIRQGPLAAPAQPDVILPVPTGQVTDMIVADLNGDSLPDIVISCGGRVEVYLNTYDSSAQNNPSHLLTFADPVEYTANDPVDPSGLVNLQSVAALQIDQPAASTSPPDLVAGGFSGVVGDAAYQGYLVRFHSLQDGSFTAPPDVFPLKDGARILAVGDFDNDGYTDLAAADSPTGRVNIILNVAATGGGRTVDPSISTPNELFTLGFIAAMAVGDVDHDGLRDLMVLNGTSDFSSNPFQFSSRLTFFQNPGAGAFANNHSSSISLKSVSSNTLTGVVGSIAIGDLNGDGTTGEMAIADGLDSDITISTVDPAGVLRNNGLYYAASTTVTAGPLARYVEAGDFDGDGGLDLIVANGDDNTPGAYFTNAVAGPVSDDLPGRGLAFGQVTVSGGEGGTIDVKVLRGKDSTGQVLAFFTESGTAVQNFGKTAGADYTITDPGIGQPVKFKDDTDHVEHIKISVAKSPGAEPTKTIVLTLLDPVGDSELSSADQTSITILLVDGKPSVLTKPVFTVTPTSIVKQTPAFLKAIGVKAQVRDYAAVNFTAVEAFAKGTRHPALQVQTTTTPLDDTSWATYKALANTKGTTWTGSGFVFPIVQKLYFRVKATADGYPDLISAPVGPYQIVPGPSIGLHALQSTAVNGTFVRYPISLTAGGEVCYRLSYNADSGTDKGPADHAVIYFPIPPHTVFKGATAMNGSFPALVRKGTVVTGLNYILGTVSPGATGSATVQLQVDDTSAFSKTDPLKALGQIITATGYNFVADQVAKMPFGDIPTLVSEIKGPIDLQVTATAPSDHVGGGDLITYDLTASNTSAAEVTGGIVHDRIPIGTVLDTLYLQDANGNSDISAPFTTPTSGSNPTVVYVIVQVPKLFSLKRPDGKAYVKGDEIDIPGYVDSGFLDQSFVQFLISTGAIAEEVRWTLPTIPAGGHVALRYKVKVLFDATAPLPTGKTLASIRNDDFDFTIPAAGSPTVKISALYGHAPDATTGSLTLPLVDNGSASLVNLGLSKSFSGDSFLTDPNLTGNGSAQIFGFGEVVNAVQGKGFDVVLAWANSAASVPAHHCVIHEVIPQGAYLTGFFSQGDGQGNFAAPSRNQFVFYDKNSKPITVFDANGQYLLSVRSMDFSIDPNHPLASGAMGSLSYTLQPQPSLVPGAVLSYPHHPEIPKAPTILYFFSDRDPSLALSDPEQGTYLTTTDLQDTVGVWPATNPVRVVPPISFATIYDRSTNQRQGPGSIYHHDFLITSNSDLTATAAHLDLVLPKGVQLAPAAPPAFTDGAGGAPTVVKSGTTTSITLGSFAPHQKRALRVSLQVINVGTAQNPAVDPALAKAQYAVFAATPVTRPGGVTTARALYPGRQTAAAAKPADEAAAGYATIPQPVPVGDPLGARFSLYRGQPYTVPEAGGYTYTIAFANLGQKAATNVAVEMQVPYGVTFAGTDPGLTQSIVNGQPVLTSNPKPVTMTQRSNAGVIKGSGGGADVVTWHFDSLAPQAVGTVKLHVTAFPGIHDATVADHSLDIFADGVAKVAIAKSSIGTRILAKPFKNAGWEILGGFLERLGFPVNQDTQPPLAQYVDELTADSRLGACAAMDGLHLNNGISIFPLGNSQVMVVGGENAPGQISHTAGANRLAFGDGHEVTAGLAAAIHISAIGGTYDGQACDQLIAHAQDIANGHFARLLPAGGYNMIATDANDNPVQLSNDTSGTAVPITGSSVGVIDAGANGKILSMDATIVKSGLISQDGAGLIGNAGGALVGNAGGTLVGNAGGTLISNDGAGLVGNAGGTLVGNAGGTLVGNAGGTLVSPSGGNAITK